MAELELAPIQREILTALIGIYREKGRAVKGAEIADVIDRNPGTVRNQMQALKSLGLIEGVPGPRGGYSVTERAYQILAMDETGEEVIVPVSINGERVPDLSIRDIKLTTLTHPMICKATIKLMGNIRIFGIGDIMELGPTPVNKLIMRCEVEGRNDQDNVLMCEVKEMVSLPTGHVLNYIDRETITIPPGVTVKEAAAILLERNIWSAPLMEGKKVAGIVSLKDIARAIVFGDIGDSVKNYAKMEVISIDGMEPLSEALRIINDNDLGSLLITTDGEPEGHITRTHLLNQLVKY